MQTLSVREIKVRGPVLRFRHVEGWQEAGLCCFYSTHRFSAHDMLSSRKKASATEREICPYVDLPWNQRLHGDYHFLTCKYPADVKSSQCQRPQ